MSLDILKLRLTNTGLSQSQFKNPYEAVSHLGAVQAQDYGAAKWSLGLRIKDSVDQDLEKAFNEGSILRVHVMRPTWHFVIPENIRWMVELTAPRVKQALSPSNRKLELDDTLFKRTNSAIVKALRGHNYLTRQELNSILTKMGIRTDVQRLAHIIARAELDGLICSGPRRGKQFTYALVDERAANSPKISREQAMAKLALHYFTSHGPAQIEDFSWWSGLTVKDTKPVLELIKSELNQETIKGKTYWFSTHAGGTVPEPPPALLLSIYDEYMIAYKDRSGLSEGREIEKMLSMGNALTAVIILNRKVAGTWNKVLKKNTVEIRLNPFREHTKGEQAAIRSEIARYGRFTGIPTVLLE
jgi:hypothetical protein